MGSINNRQRRLPSPVPCSWIAWVKREPPLGGKESNRCHPQSEGVLKSTRQRSPSHCCKRKANRPCPNLVTPGISASGSTPGGFLRQLAITSRGKQSRVVPLQAASSHGRSASG